MPFYSHQIWLEQMIKGNLNKNGGLYWLKIVLQCAWMMAKVYSGSCWGIAYNQHCADMAPAQLRVGGVLHVYDPAGHQHSQPCHHQVLHLNCRQTRLSTNGEGKKQRKSMIRN